MGATVVVIIVSRWVGRTIVIIVVVAGVVGGSIILVPGCAGIVLVVVRSDGYREAEVLGFGPGRNQGKQPKS